MIMILEVRYNSLILLVLFFLILWVEASQPPYIFSDSVFFQMTQFVIKVKDECKQTHNIQRENTFT